MSQDNLKSKTIKGAGWSAADAILGQGVSFIVGLVLARLLSPEEYGLIGIVMIFVTVLNGIVDSGFSTAVIRKQDANDEDYNTMFYTNMLFSIILYACLILSSPLIASFFGREELIQLVPAMGLILIINALSLTQQTILTKRIDFKTKTKASLLSSVTSGVVGIICAYCGFGVWSLVLQKLLQQILYTGSLWILNKWWPSFLFSKDSFHYMWGFGWKIMISGLLESIWKQVNKLVVGRFYSPSALGQYTRSCEYANIFSQNITVIIQRVSYPVLSKIKNDNERMIVAYKKLLQVTMFITIVCLFSIGAIAQPLIYCLIGPKWNLAAEYLPYICLAMVFYPIQAINLNILKVLGRSDIFLYLEIAKKIIAIVPICLGIFFNIKAMLIGSIIYNFIEFFMDAYYTGKEFGYTAWNQLVDISNSFFVALCVTISVFFLKYLPLNEFVILVLQLLTGSFVFLCVCEKKRIKEYMEIKAIIKGMINKKK